MCIRDSLPIMPVPHSATLIMCRSSSRGCNHAYKLCNESHSSPVLSTGVAAGARRRTQVAREASRPAANGCGGAGREAGADALRREALEEAGRPCPARGWKALCPSSLLGRGGAGQRTPTGAPHAMWAAGGGQPFAPRAGYSRLIRRRSSVRRARTGLGGMCSRSSGGSSRISRRRSRLSRMPGSATG